MFLLSPEKVLTRRIFKTKKKLSQKATAIDYSNLRADDDAMIWMPCQVARTHYPLWGTRGERNQLTPYLCQNNAASVCVVVVVVLLSTEENERKGWRCSAPVCFVCARRAASSTSSYEERSSIHPSSDGGGRSRLEGSLTYNFSVFRHMQQRERAVIHPPAGSRSTPWKDSFFFVSTFSVVTVFCTAKDLYDDDSSYVNEIRWEFQFFW